MNCWPIERVREATERRQRLDAAAEADRIAERIGDIVLRDLRRRGAVLGLSGGVDSSVCAALCARALGPERVLCLLMPERESSPNSVRLGEMVAGALGVRTELVDITSILEACHCYTRREAAVRDLVPDYESRCGFKVVAPRMESGNEMRFYSFRVERPTGEFVTVRPSHAAFMSVIAATNYKQRVRKMVEYYYADLHHHAVVGTPNLVEYDQGFFVKGGDGAADLKPIAHLYKTQVYRLAEYLGIPAEVRRQRPTTDTYSLEQTQEEFYFGVPFEVMDLCLHEIDRDVAPVVLAEELGVDAERIENVYREIRTKRKATAYLHAQPRVLEPPLAPLDLEDEGSRAGRRRHAGLERLEH